LTFDENAEYIEENYDPDSYDTYDELLLDIYKDYQRFSNNPGVVLREDITDFIQNMYDRAKGMVTFEEPELGAIEEFLPPTEEELVKEITEPSIEELETRYQSLLERYYDLLKSKIAKFFKRSPI